MRSNRLRLYVRSLTILLAFCGGIPVLAQKGPKQWTEWTPVTGDWAEFRVVVNFKGKARSKEELATADLKSLKVDCVIGGRFKGGVPPEIKGVKTFKILYTEFGKFYTPEGFQVDYDEIPYSDDGNNVRPTGIYRPASQFDIEEAGKKPADLAVTERNPTILAPYGVELLSTGTMSGQIYRLEMEWRRKGSLVEIKLKDYRPR